MTPRDPLLLLAALAVAAAPAAAQSEPLVEPTSFEQTGVLHAKVRETSGVAVSRRYPGLLWTHNDSGDGPFLYATNLQGDDLGTYRVLGAAAEDWEDLAIGPCPEDRAASCLYIADTGDNMARRATVAVYVVPEPAFPPPGGATEAETKRAHRIAIAYPDGPRDVEAIAVAPDGEISLMSKGRTGVIRRYRIPPAAARQGSVTALAAETLPIIPDLRMGRQATGAAFSPDGRVLVVRTYTELVFFQRDARGGLGAAGAPCWLGLRQPLGEAVDFLNADTLVLTTEAAFGQPASIATVRCPEAAHPPGAR